MKLIKDFLEFGWYIFLGTLIRPIYKFFKAWLVERDEWIYEKLSERNCFKRNIRKGIK